ncbi:MAG: hypothetical protein M3N13_00220 [Candidatus Eremiobacteraeota bacterium]|nr:hypothetical protein [Candidatus Eremiobacteraeota bacterium]
MNSAEYRVVAALLSAIGSGIPDPMVAIIAESVKGEWDSPVHTRGGGAISPLSVEQMRDTEQEGWVSVPGIVNDDLPSSEARVHRGVRVPFLWEKSLFHNIWLRTKVGGDSS